MPLVFALGSGGNTLSMASPCWGGALHTATLHRHRRPWFLQGYWAGAHGAGGIGSLRAQIWLLWVKSKQCSPTCCWEGTKGEPQGAPARQSGGFLSWLVIAALPQMSWTKSQALGGGHSIRWSCWLSPSKARWKLNVGLLWSILMWCCSTSHGPTEPQTSSVPRPGVLGHLPALFMVAVPPLLCQPMLPMPSQVLPANTNSGAKQRVPSPGSSGKLYCTSLRRLRGVHPWGAFPVDILAGCSSKLSLLHPRMLWSHSRVVTSALPLGWNGKGTCSVLHPPISCSGAYFFEQVKE